MEKKILIVDDDKPMARLLSEALKALSVPTSIASVPSGEEAMLSVILDHPSLVIMDLGLPGMSGWDLLALVRKRNPQMAVILTTGKRDEDVLKRGKDFHVDAIFFKPVELKDLLAKVEELLGAELPPAAVDVPVTDSPSVPVPPKEKSKQLPSKSFKQIVRELRQDMQAETVAILSDSGHLMVQAGRDPAEWLREGWEIHVMAALSACQALEKTLQNPVQNQYLLLALAEQHTLLLLPVGRHGLLVFLSGDAAESMITGNINRLYEAQTLMTEFNEPFIVDDTGHLTPLVEHPLQVMAEEEPEEEVVADIDLDQLFAPAAATGDLDEFWDEAAEILSAGSSNTGYLNFTQAEQLGLVPDELEDEA